MHTQGEFQRNCNKGTIYRVVEKETKWNAAAPRATGFHTISTLLTGTGIYPVKNRDARMQWGLVLGTFMGNKVSPFCGSTQKEASRQEILQKRSQSSTDECGYGIKERGGKSQHTCQNAHCLHKNTKGKRRPSYKRRKPWFECRICI